MYFYLPHTHIPMYGFLITLGMTISCVIAYILCRKKNLDVNDLIIIITTLVLFGLLGAKLFYILQIVLEGDFIISNINDVIQLFKGGFVFYGGFITGAIGYFILRKIYKNINTYINYFIFALPLTHAFGRIGCFNASCCYGIRYDGPLSIVYNNAVFAPNHVHLFPVQLVEASLLFILSMALLYRSFTDYKVYNNLKIYIFFYAIIRFILEYLRGDSIRGKFFLFSTSQWIALIIIIIILVYEGVRRIILSKNKINL